MQSKGLFLGFLGVVLALGLLGSLIALPTTASTSINGTTTGNATNTATANSSSILSSIHQFYQQHKTLVLLTILFIGVAVFVSLFVRR